MDNSERIIKYIDKELSENEKAEFEKELLSNPELMQDYKLHIEVDEFLEKKFAGDITVKRNEEKDDGDIADEVLAIEKEAIEKNVFNETIEFVNLWNKEKGGLQLEEQRNFVAKGLKNIRKNEKHNEGRVSATSKKLWVYWGSAIAAVFLLGVLLTFLLQEKDSGELYAEYYQTYEFAVSTRSENNAVESGVNKAMKLYNKGAYDNAITESVVVLETDKENIEAHFVQGVSLMAKEAFKDAVKEFEFVIAKNSRFHFESKWYSGLCYLKLEQKNKAVKMLKQLETSTDLYEKSSKKLLREIE